VYQIVNIDIKCITMLLVYTSGQSEELPSWERERQRERERERGKCTHFEVDKVGNDFDLEHPQAILSHFAGVFIGLRVVPLGFWGGGKDREHLRHLERIAHLMAFLMSFRTSA